ncbi:MULTISPECIES: cyclic pyranopterin monophosphate synthase MoaC [Idiomarina]|jgi:cyclic pyranopterin phosphate synthase|uniref:Cyclic pyranopterin monophosphate synthase n=1 Tax=Idiomarina abyssalis TaxID=86102 RepID=A0A8I1KH49_9GAMM|nr:MULTISPECIES: cyclic pyranopterin monophosphate synthase MoaC [Idiomarina]MAL83350.1 cyclic pyranopterin monophosphate synthase MoaC [Idiomarina sp.]MAO68892.1 cyclic pyranopterin monophosphate synthase MoaC [Idiomarina sp.]MBF81060.1 cyclic pyranopterin monophosphate synthase MoaC [Idiomarina sp.]MBH93603.1 cyclic pyranopterin monophosphate synthase MoaC [Idiomarina sp.]MBJ7266259.1 cyclic pyranopterin monophosphate synthase MoaC [Idiomarina abyssalis]|tara:strand:+ start:285 stop:773 length:489 start_codon:yes stop_codon:yes gene_type:complete
MSELTHLNQHGEAHMVDVADKATTTRIAVAQSRLRSRTDVIELLEAAAAKKGDVLATARIAGIMAAKKCSELIPLCHPLALTKVTIDFELDHEKGEVRIQSLCKVTGSTGVEMEALTAASVAALTVYDMCKAVDPAMVITDTCLLEKEGGKRGHWTRGGTPL